jgi:hypothetical protein
VELLQQVCGHASGQLQQAAALPSDVWLDFDPAAEESLPPSEVVKTSRRTVIGLAGRFAAREIVRRRTDDGSLQRSARLAGLVPRGANYAFDVMTDVGLESWLRGRRLADIQQALANRQPALSIPLSSLYDQQQKFLFCLGHLHQQATPRLREYLHGQGGVTWLLDGILETDSPVFLGIRDAESGILLAAWRIPSENGEDIARCLAQGAQHYGRPDRVLHDLSAAMLGGCEAGLPGVPHFVCHYHLARDVGEDLYRKPQDALCKRMRSLKVPWRMREQRKGQTEWFRTVPDAPMQRMLENLLAGRPVGASFAHTLGREVLLACHHWILDYRSDGRRRGYPFDPYTLYLHRRLVRAAEAMDRLLADAAVAHQAPQVLRHFQRLLNDYRRDAEIVAAAELYERSWAMFSRLRQALSLTADQMDNLRQVHELPPEEQQQFQTALEELRLQLREQSQTAGDADAPLATTVLNHLDKYWSHLVPDQPAGGGPWKRTTNELESQWNVLKRGRRRTHGRGKLTRDFQALPEEYVLIANLENPIYVDLVLDGSLENLSDKFAEASRRAGSFSAWRQMHHARLIGQPPRRLLRQDGFIDQLVTVCHQHCHETHRAAA